MKKFIALVLCIMFFLCGCDQKAEPFYEETNEFITLTTTYTYYFSDETYLLCRWNNKTEGYIRFDDVFELQRLGSDGEWYVIKELGEAEFNTSYCHEIEANTECLARYDIDLFTGSLNNGVTYRISTYCYDENNNYYQIYAEFICDDEAAEKELKELSSAALEGIEEDGVAENN